MIKASVLPRNVIAEGLSTGKIEVNMSSVSPLETKDFALGINTLGGTCLDVPVPVAKPRQECDTLVHGRQN